MKKIILSLLLFASAYAGEPFGYITGKIVPLENKGYWIFSDGSFWQVTTFVKRWRSPLEWVSGVELYVPDEYLSNLTDWSLGDEFEEYPKYGNSRIDESAASNQDDLKKCTHILVNSRTGKILFATALHPSDFILEVFNEGHGIGYFKGYNSGYDWGYSSGRAATNINEN